MLFKDDVNLQIIFFFVHKSCLPLFIDFISKHNFSSAFFIMHSRNQIFSRRVFWDLTSEPENASYQPLKLSGNWNSHSKCVVDMEGCGRRGGLRSHFLCYTCNHFPVPGICAATGQDLAKYFRQDLAGPKFDLWWVMFSIKEVQACREVQTGCFDLLLVWAICYIMWQNVICPPPNPCPFFLWV